MSKLVRFPELCDEYCQLPRTFSDDEHVAEAFQQMFREADRKRKRQRDIRFKIATYLCLAAFLWLFGWGVALAIDKGF